LGGAINYRYADGVLTGSSKHPRRGAGRREKARKHERQTPDATAIKLKVNQRLKPTGWQSKGGTKTVTN